MNKPKISVIMPVYNVEKYLSECIDSIVNQTLKDIEIICVNDGSTDKSLAILKEYASNDDRIKIIDKKNEGQGYARKVGLDIAKGEYILFCDSDDKYVSNDVFEKLYYEIKKNDSELMIFRFLFGNRKSNLLDKYINSKDKNISILIFNLYFAPWFKIYKKSFFDRYEYWCFPKYLKFEDIPFHIQVCLRVKSITFSNNISYYYREDNSASTMNSRKGRKQVENICEIMLLVYDVIKKENLLDKYILEFSFLAISRIIDFFILTFQRTDLVSIIKDTFEKLSLVINNAIKKYSPNKIINFPYLNLNYILFYKVFIRLDLERLCKYIEGKKQKKLYNLQKELSNYKKIIEPDDKKSIITDIDSVIKQKNSEIQNLHIQNNIKDQFIKRLQNSWSYRIGRIFTYPLSIPLEFLKFIRDYNLIKKSDLFDIEYYLANNEDVKNAKMNPIKHYLKFGWKEGRNPSEKFNGNEYLNKRPDVRVAGICPLVHYIRFGKYENE